MTQDTQGLWQVPSGWAWCQLADIGDVASGGTPSTARKEFFSGDIAWITPADLSGFNGAYIGRGARSLSLEGVKASSAVVLPTGTIVFSSRAPIGYVAIASNPLATNQGCKNLTLHEGLSREYVYYYLKASKSLVEKHASGTTFLEISAPKFSQLPIPLSPLHEQRRIVAKIEELFTQLDAGIAALKQAQAQLKRYRQAVLKAAFEGRLTTAWREEHGGEVEPIDVLLARAGQAQGKGAARAFMQGDRHFPEGFGLSETPSEWVWVTLGEMIESMKNGIYKPPDYYAETGVACLRMYNINDGAVIWKGVKRMRLTEEDVQQYALRPGDILVNRVNSRELVGKSAVIPPGLETCVYESKNIRLRINQACLSSKYANWWLLLSARRFFNRNVQQTVGMASINQEQLAALPIPVPALLEQEQIAAQIETLFSMGGDVTRVIEQSIRQANSLRQSILRAAFAGKLVVQDPADEPAERLLERIRQERERGAVETAAARTRSRPAAASGRRGARASAEQLALPGVRDGQPA